MTQSVLDELSLDRRRFIRDAAIVAWATPTILTLSASRAGAQSAPCKANGSSCDSCFGCGGAGVPCDDMSCCDTVSSNNSAGCCCATVEDCLGTCIDPDLGQCEAGNNLTDEDDPTNTYCWCSGPADCAGFVTTDSASARGSGMSKKRRS